MDTNDVPIIADPVYEHDVLLKTHAFLQKGFTVREPSDVASAVDWVYDRAAQEVDRTAWLTRLEETTSRTEAKRDRYHENAEDVMICPPSGWYLITEGATGLDESDDTPGSQMAARTRLEDRPSVNLVIMGPSDPWPPDSYNKDVKRALALRTVRMPAYRLCQDELNDLDRPANWEQSGVSKYAVPIKLREDGGFETESYRFHYDEEVGLTAHRKNGEF